MRDQSVDPKAAPGSYEQTKDGFKRLEEPTAPAVLEHRHAGLDLDTAKAIAAASEASGFPPPPQVQAVIEAAASGVATDDQVVIEDVTPVVVADQVEPIAAADGAAEPKEPRRRGARPADAEIQE